MTAFDEDLLRILVEPGTQNPLRYDIEHQHLICEASGLAYPIRDGIPCLIPEDAVPVASLTSPDQDTPT